MAQPVKKFVKVETKQALVEELRGEFAGAGSIVFFSYQGLKVSDFSQLRNTVRSTGGRLAVVKNTILRRVTDGENTKAVHEHLFGDTAVCISGAEDPVMPVKELVAFSKKFEQIRVKAGVLDGKAITGAEVVALSKLPTKNELLAKLLGSINAPASNLVGALSGLARNLVYAIEGIRKQKEAAGA